MAETSQMQAAFSQLGEPLSGELSDAQLVEASLARFMSADAQALLLEIEDTPIDAPAPVASRRRGWAIVLAIAAVCVLAFSLWGGGLELLRGSMDGTLYGSAASMTAEQKAAKHTAQTGLSSARDQPANHRATARKVVAPEVAHEEQIEVASSAAMPEVGLSEESSDSISGTAEQPTSGTAEPADEEPVASADELLEQAQALLAKGQTSRARRAYRSLIEHYPASREARASRVTLGRLALAAGHPRKALRWFERYLAGGSGSLAEEAAVGRMQALRELGRVETEQQAIEAFLADPARATSLYRGRLGRRLVQLKKTDAPGETEARP